MVEVFMFTVHNCQPTTSFVGNIQEVINCKIKEFCIQERDIISINISLPNSTFTREVIIIVKR